MKISWLGHSAFKLEESTGTTLISDPYSPKLGLKLPQMNADVISVSCENCFNSYTADIEGNPTIIRRPGTYEMEGIHIFGFSESQLNKSNTKNVIYKYRLDGVDVCHMGNISSECTTLLVETLAPIDVLLIPVGGHDVIDADLAKEYIEKLMPSVVIPMKYRDKEANYTLNKLHDFLELFDEKDIIYSDTKTVEFDRYKVDSEETKVLILEKNI